MGILILKLVVGWLGLLYVNFWLDRPLTKYFTGLDARMKLIIFSVFDLRNVVVAIFTLLISYFIAKAGWLQGLETFLNIQGPALSVLYWIIEPSFLSLLVFAGLGFSYGLVGRSFGFSVLLGIVFLFPGIVSGPGLSLMIFGEMAGQGFSFFRRLGVESSNFVLRARLLIQAFCVLAFWAGGGLIREFLYALDLKPLFLNDRLMETSLLVAILVFADTFMSMGFYHFYYRRTKDQSPIKA